MDCACVVSHSVENENSWGFRKINRAAKDHKCYECAGTIPKGASYFYHTCFGDGTASNYKICPDCQSVINQFFSDGWWFGCVWDSLADYLYENWQDDLPSSCISKLLPFAQNKVCDILQEIHESREVAA